MLDLEPIKKRCETAAQGPWRYVDLHGEIKIYDRKGSHAHTDNDFNFMVHARTDIPNLIAEIERWRSRTKPIPIPKRITTIDGIPVAEYLWYDNLVVYVDDELTEDTYDNAVEKLKAGVE